MGGDKYSELILETIDQLRKRKARPDLDRICHMLERRHGLKSVEVSEQLADMVDSGAVIKVDYKGNTSYRNAAKWVRTKSLFKPDFTSVDMAIAVQDAVRAISCPGEPGNSTVRCASLHDIEKYLLKRETMCNMNIATLRSTLEREVAHGNIRQVRTGEYVSISPSSNNMPTEFSEKSSRVSDDVDDNSHLVPKRFKDDAESINIPKDSEEEISCDYCLLTPGSNRNGEPEGLLVCKDCDMKAHPSCIDYSGEVAKMVMLSPWQCPDCKICAVCSECGDEDDMVICRGCDKGYHITCHKPPLLVKPKVLTSWSCFNCLKHDFWKPDKPSHDDNTAPANVDISTSYPQVSKEEGIAFVFQKCLENYPDVVPIVDEWTIEEVQMFLKHIGFHDEALAFEEQEIDGQSLLLMKRNDVLTGLSIKLGPALKIYSHVKRLQNVKTLDGPSIWHPD